MRKEIRFLVRLRPRDGGGQSFLRTIRSLADSVMTEARNPKWTSYGALEIDVFAHSASDFDLFLSAASPLADVEFSKNLNEVPIAKPKELLIDEGRTYFNSERYWECHEVLESVWRTVSGIEKRYVQGVILVCAAFVHHQKGEEEIASGVLARALEQLSFEKEDYYGISVSGLRKEVETILKDGRFHNFRL